MSFVLLLTESDYCRLVKMNRIDEAKEVFSAIYEVPPDSQTVSRNIRDIQLSLELAQNVDLKAMFQMGPHRTFHRVVLAATIQMFLQMTGESGQRPFLKCWNPFLETERHTRVEIYATRKDNHLTQATLKHSRDTF